MFDTSNVILPLLNLFVNINFLLVGVIIISFIVIMIGAIVQEPGLIFTVLILAGGLSLVVMNADMEHTDKISEAKYVNADSFSQKIIKVGQLESLSSNSKEAISDIKIDLLKDSYMDLSGTRDGKKVGVVVEFDKNDTITVKVSKDGIDNDSEYDSFEYIPKN